MSDELLPDLLTAVDQQLASKQTPYVAKAFQRLVKEGMSEDEAKEQIAWCLAEQMDEVMRTKRGFDEDAYRAALDELPVSDEEE